MKKNKKTYYLVDLENAGVAGLNSIQNHENSKVILFSTPNNSAKIPSEALCNLGAAHLKFFMVPQKKQSVDEHIMSYLGYLVGKKNGAKFVIVSNDSDYDNIISFWKREKGADIKRQTTITSETMQTEAKSVIKEIKKPVVKKAVKKANALTKAEYNTKIMQALSKAKIDNRKVGEVASICSKQYSQVNRKELISDALNKKYGQAEGAELFSVIKGII